MTEAHRYTGLIDKYRDRLPIKPDTPAVSLGGVETTICDPVSTSHAKMTAETRAKQGITDGLLRLSVGIENASDLIEDLEQALEGQWKGLWEAKG